MSCGNSVRNFLRNLRTVFPHGGCTSLYSHEQRVRVPFAPQPLQRWWTVAMLTGEVVACCSFDPRFPNTRWSWASPPVSVGHSHVFLGEVSVQVLFPFHRAVCLMWIYVSSLYLGY